MKQACVILMCIGVATAALAHTGVKNAAVKARMEGMSRLAAHAKVLGTGLRTGASQAEMTAAAAALRHEAGTIATLFMPQEDDPKSEARAAIWANWSDFQSPLGCTCRSVSGGSGRDHAGGIERRIPPGRRCLLRLSQGLP